MTCTLEAEATPGREKHNNTNENLLNELKFQHFSKSIEINWTIRLEDLEVITGSFQRNPFFSIVPWRNFNSRRERDSEESKVPSLQPGALYTMTDLASTTTSTLWSGPKRRPTRMELGGSRRPDCVGVELHHRNWIKGRLGQGGSTAERNSQWESISCPHHYLRHSVKEQSVGRVGNVRVSTWTGVKSCFGGQHAHHNGGNIMWPAVFGSTVFCLWVNPLSQKVGGVKDMDDEVDHQPSELRFDSGVAEYRFAMTFVCEAGVDPLNIVSLCSDLSD